MLNHRLPLSDVPLNPVPFRPVPSRIKVGKHWMNFHTPDLGYWTATPGLGVGRWYGCGSGVEPTRMLSEVNQQRHNVITHEYKWNNNHIMFICNQLYIFRLLKRMAEHLPYEEGRRLFPCSSILLAYLSGFIFPDAGKTQFIYFSSAITLWKVRLKIFPWIYNLFSCGCVSAKLLILNKRLAQVAGAAGVKVDSEYLQRLETLHTNGTTALVWFDHVMGTRVTWP